MVDQVKKIANLNAWSTGQVFSVTNHAHVIRVLFQLLQFALNFILSILILLCLTATQARKTFLLSLYSITWVATWEGLGTNDFGTILTFLLSTN